MQYSGTYLLADLSLIAPRKHSQIRKQCRGGEHRRIFDLVEFRSKDNIVFDGSTDSRSHSETDQASRPNLFLIQEV